MRALAGLKKVREGAALTQEELAKRSGVGRATIAGLEAGSRRARPATAQKLAGAIGVDPGQLVEASPAGRSELVDAGGAEGGPFTAVFEEGEQGWWVATCPEVPEAITQGRTVEEARENLKDAIRLELEIRREEAEEDLEGREVIRERLAL